MEIISLQVYGNKRLLDSSSPLDETYRVVHHMTLKDSMYMEQRVFPWSYESIFFSKNEAAIINVNIGWFNFWKNDWVI